MKKVASNGPITPSAVLVARKQAGTTSKQVKVRVPSARKSQQKDTTRNAIYSVMQAKSVKTGNGGRNKPLNVAQSQ